MAYLAMYGHSSVNSVVFYAPTILGVVTCGEAFSGKLSIDADAVDRYAEQSLGNDPVNDFLKASVSLLNATNTLDLSAELIEKIYKKVRENVVPRLVIDTYANMPCYWSMVGEKDYEDAKQFIFAGKEDTYRGLIEKIDNYHYNIQMKAPELLKRYQSEGLSIGIVVKYGYQTPPIFDTCDEMTDDTITVERASFGATCTKLTETFSGDYLENARINGTDKYISPDKKIDASTCLLPDNTWFIKDCSHLNFPGKVNKLLISIVNYKGQMTVKSKSSYPQYLRYDEEQNKLYPLTEEAPGRLFSDKTFIQTVKDFFKALANLLKYGFDGLLGKIKK